MEDYKECSGSRKLVRHGFNNNSPRAVRKSICPVCHKEVELWGWGWKQGEAYLMNH